MGASRQIKIKIPNNEPNKKHHEDLRFWIGVTGFLIAFIPGIVACQILQIFLNTLKLDFELIKNKPYLIAIASLLALYFFLKITIHFIKKCKLEEEKKRATPSRYDDLAFWNRTLLPLRRYILGFIAGQFFCIGIAFLEKDHSFLTDRTHHIFLGILAVVITSLCLLSLLNKKLNYKKSDQKSTTKEVVIGVLDFVTMCVPGAIAGIIMKCMKCDFSFFEDESRQQQIIVCVLVLIFVLMKLTPYVYEKISKSKIYERNIKKSEAECQECGIKQLKKLITPEQMQLIFSLISDLLERSPNAEIILKVESLNHEYTPIIETMINKNRWEMQHDVPPSYLTIYPEINLQR